MDKCEKCEKKFLYPYLNYSSNYYFECDQINSNDEQKELNRTSCPEKIFPSSIITVVAADSTDTHNSSCCFKLQLVFEKTCLQRYFFVAIFSFSQALVAFSPLYKSRFAVHTLLFQLHSLLSQINSIYRWSISIFCFMPFSFYLCATIQLKVCSICVASEKYCPTLT